MIRTLHRLGKWKKYINRNMYMYKQRIVIAYEHNKKTTNVELKNKITIRN